MRKRRELRFRLLILGSVALLSVVTFASPPQQVQEPPLPATAPAAQTSEPEFKLRVQKNVVVVRVVVRDSKGRAVGGLRKEDFRITDNKKPQEIGSFSVETSAAAALPAQPPAAAPAAKPGQEAATAPAAPTAYLAFYFDDLYSVQDSLYRAGQAAEKFLAGLPATERVAIFTSSGFQTLDFTDDRQKIHEALIKLRANTRVNPKDDCPEINDYMAFSVVQYGVGPSEGVSGVGGAIGIIIDEAINHCHMPPSMVEKIKPEYWRSLAQKAYDAYAFQSRDVLKNLDAVVERVAAMPGERQVMLVSDGFMDLEMHNRVESVVDHALRAHVTISALDAGGLRVDLLEVDASRQYMASGELAVEANAFNFARRAADQGTLAEIAEGTGGQFFHDNNDLLAGMRKILLPPEVSYVLTFSPTELKADGAFHDLKVTLANGHGLTIQARKGYFAPKLVSPEELAKTEIREAVYSSYPIQDLSLTFETEVRKTEGQNEDIAVQARLDVRNLPFQKQGDLNLDNVVFAVGLFDHDGKYVSGSQQTYSLFLTDTTRAEMEKRGLSLKTHVSAKTGAYTLRVVVRDSQGGKMAASSKAVEVPSQPAPPPAPKVVPSGPAVVRNSPGPEMAALSKTTEVPSRTVPPLKAQQAVLSGPDADFFEAYRRSDPITKWPLKKTKSRIPELNGLKPATDQSRLPGILRGVSENLQKFVTNFVNIAALETVDETAQLRSGRGAVDENEELRRRREALEIWEGAHFWQPVEQIKQKYRYLVMGRKEGEALTLVEYRTDLGGEKNRPKSYRRNSSRQAALPQCPSSSGLLNSLGPTSVCWASRRSAAIAPRPWPSPSTLSQWR